MQEYIFFDTDCISAFLWINKEKILIDLYSKKMVIPNQVYKEMSKPNVSWMKRRMDILIQKGIVKIESIPLDSEEYSVYYQLTETNSKIIGKGEAAAICLAKKHSGIVASNNLKDIEKYVIKYKLKATTTADIIVEAYKSGKITRNKAEKIWDKMIGKKRKLGADTFDEFIKVNEVE